mmetsp:Transcript_18089/g.23111  ORF Transcript_18089/g.23111 Transcript_18089/m.23111 type:complete len:156 (-) Transcript_18089:841-1308(-)
MVDKPMIFEFGLKAKRDENRRLRAESTRGAETENNKEVKRVRFAEECPSASNDSPVNDDWERQSNWSDRRSDGGKSHSTLRSAPATRIRKHDSDAFSRGPYSIMSTRRRRCSGVTLPDSFKASRIAEALDMLPAECLVGNLQHSLRTVPSSRMNY